MVSTTADAHLAPSAPAAEVRGKPMPDNSSVGFATPNGFFMVVYLLSAIATFALPFILTSMGPHH